MKKIVILTCPKSEDVCTGGGCFHAFNHCTQRFAAYGGEELEMEAFMKCSGCGHFPGKDKGLDEKIDYILRIHPDAVHVGICCCHDGRDRTLCPEVEAICHTFKEQGISIIFGTHSIFEGPESLREIESKTDREGV